MVALIQDIAPPKSYKQNVTGACESGQWRQVRKGAVFQQMPKGFFQALKRVKNKTQRKKINTKQQNENCTYTSKCRF